MIHEIEKKTVTFFSNSMNHNKSNPRFGIKVAVLHYLKFIYSEKATKFWEIFTLLLSYVVPVKSKVKISQNFVTFSEYMNFKIDEIFQLLR